jgi:histidine ammonia-lyase
VQFQNFIIIFDLTGTINAFFPVIHEARPHPGQIYSAAQIRSCIHSDQFPSEIHADIKVQKIQDAYSLRCAPQVILKILFALISKVHGVVHDTLNFVKQVLETEINSATDNPMVVFGKPGTPGWIVSGLEFL